MIRRRKSVFDLSDFAYLKVPRPIYNKLVEIAGKKLHWSEVAREILNWWVNDESPTKEQNTDE